jgi:hypothetical protein
MAHSGWVCCRNARRLGLNRRGPRWLAFPFEGPSAVGQTAVGYGCWTFNRRGPRKTVVRHGVWWLNLS